MNMSEPIGNPEAGGCCPPATCSVPYADLPLQSPEKIKWTDGQAFTFKDGRKVAAYRSPAGPGIFFRITSPIGDGKESELKFRLSDEAAAALAALIYEKLKAPNSD